MNEKILCIIPARGGSKRLTGKNILDLCGKPLIAWTIEQARASKYLDKIIVSTDDEKIARISREYGAEVPFLRPAQFA
ncbi:MAG: acylneuraminate cytidylyltransferase family protein, partial [Methanobacterium sp.]